MIILLRFLVGPTVGSPRGRIQSIDDKSGDSKGGCNELTVPF